MPGIEYPAPLTGTEANSQSTSDVALGNDTPVDIAIQAVGLTVVVCSVVADGPAVAAKILYEPTGWVGRTSSASKPTTRVSVKLLSTKDELPQTV